jgi:hypothetical protein
MQASDTSNFHGLLLSRCITDKELFELVAERKGTLSPNESCIDLEDLAFIAESEVKQFLECDVKKERLVTIEILVLRNTCARAGRTT